MNPDEVNRLRNRLLLLAEYSSSNQLPQNVKRKAKPTNTSPKARLKSGPKWTMQDFVRRDPGYTPDIEHLVFPGRKMPQPRPQEVAANRTRSRLAEMFALSRHLQQRSTERDVKTLRDAGVINRSMDSALGLERGSSHAEPRAGKTVRRWMTVEEPVRQLNLSSLAEPEIASARGSNVHHVRGASNQWDVSPIIPGFPSSSIRYNSRGNPGSALTKHQSMGGNTGYRLEKASSFYAEGQANSCSRELSPVRWCDREVDGVYLGRSGWVQVQQRSLDDTRRMANYGPSSLESSRRTGIKLANYHCNSEPARKVHERPVYLPLPVNKSPSPPPPPDSPPSITPIISPPPAFQDRKTNFLSRSNAIVDSPPVSPPPKQAGRNATLPQVSQSRKAKLTPSPVSRPPILYQQAKSLEDAAVSKLKRSQFCQSSSGSSSSAGFRSLDSYVNRQVMPRLSENTTDSSIDVHEDADEEDNNSSSVNTCDVPANREKVSPSGRPRHQRPRRSPASSDSNKQTNCSSDSSSDEFPGHQVRRSNHDLSQKVRRSRSLQLPDKSQTRGGGGGGVSPQHHHRAIKTNPNQVKRQTSKIQTDEIVAEFLYGTRSRFSPAGRTWKNGCDVYFPGQDKPKVLQRGVSSPNPVKVPEKFAAATQRDFWPHRMKVSQSYPTEVPAPKRRSPRLPSPSNNLRVSPSGSRPPSADRNSSDSTSSSDVWITTSDRTASKSPRNLKGSGASTPLEDVTARPGSAPADDNAAGNVEAQQRSLSLPKSFLSVNYQVGHNSQEKDAGGFSSSSADKRRPVTPEVAHTAPVTPLHEANSKQSPSAVGNEGKPPPKANSTPQLLEQVVPDGSKASKAKLLPTQHSLPGTDPAATPESVLAKFKKTFSFRLHYQKKNGQAAESQVTKIDHTQSDSSTSSISNSSAEEVAENAAPIVEEPNELHKKYGKGTIWRFTKLGKALEAERLQKEAEMQKAAEAVASNDCDETDTNETTDETPKEDEISSILKPVKPAKRVSFMLSQNCIVEFVRDCDYDGTPPRVIQKGTSSSQSDAENLLQSPNIDMNETEVVQSHVLTRSQSQMGDSNLLDVADYQQQSTSFMDESLPNPSWENVEISCNPSLKRYASQMNVAEQAMPDHKPRIVGEILAKFDPSDVSLPSTSHQTLETIREEEHYLVADAVFDNIAMEPDHLAFKAGDVVQVLETYNPEWWWGISNNKEGWFPSLFVRIRVNQASEPAASPMIGDTIDQVRAGVVLELVHTEGELVNVLQDVVTDYITECRSRPHLFSETQIATIFMNLEDILEFQKAFFEDLESRIDWLNPHLSRVGGCFLRKRRGFEMYSEYTNGFPMANVLLQELFKSETYRNIFEMCRLKRDFAVMPLDSQMAMPVQKICKYPLQLAELLKYTKPEHADFEEVGEALHVMKNVAVMINEKKRRMESLEKLHAWQMRVENWEGDDLINKSSILIRHGDVSRITDKKKVNNVVMFLFDRQLIYCKKNLSKKRIFAYKGRFDLDASEITDIPNGKDTLSGVTVKNAVRVFNIVNESWILFCLKSTIEKQAWLSAFEEERKTMLLDKANGLHFNGRAIRLAKAAAVEFKKP